MTDGERLAQALRDARDVEKVNLFRGRARGGWEAAVTRRSNPGAWALGIDPDPVVALLTALGKVPSLAQQPSSMAPRAAAEPAGIFD